MGQTARDRHTIQDIYDLPDGTRAELIDGFIYDMATPGSTHQRVVGRLFRKLADHFEKKHGACEVFIAPFAVFLNDDDYTWVEPDLCVVCDASKIKKDGCHGAPDLVVEVVSESSIKRDYLVKLLKYTRSGVHEYWIVDPERKRIIVYFLDEDNEEVMEYSFDDVVASVAFEGLTVDFKEI